MHRLAVLVVLCVVLLPVTVARAAPGPVVATLGDAALHARVKHGDLCLVVTAPELDEPEVCGDPPASAFTPVSTDEIVVGTGGPAAGYAFPSTVAAVTSDAGGRLSRHETVAAPGFPARFVLLPPDRTEGAILRAYDATGRLVAALQPDRGLSSVGARTVYRAPGVAVQVRTQRQLEPDPLRIDRIIRATCLAVRTADGSQGGCSAGPPAFDVDATPLCAPGRTTITGIVPEQVRSVRVELGGGGTLRRMTRRLPAAFGAQRLVALGVPPGEAVRRVLGLDARGRRLGSRPVGAAPGGLPCPPREDGFSSTGQDFLVLDGSPPRAAGPLRAVAESGGHRLLAADGARRSLCVAVDRPARPECAVPPEQASRSLLERHGRTLGGVMSGDVARVDLRLDDGSRLRAPTDPGAGYTGRYAGLVRFLAVRLDAGRFVRSAVARDADGRRLGRVLVTSPRRPRTTRRRLGDGLVVHRQGVVAEGRRSVDACVQAARPSGFGAAALCGRPDGFDSSQTAVAVSCASRRTIVFGRLPAGTTGATVTTTDGRRLDARVRRVRGVGRLFSAVVPADRGLAAVDLTGTPRATRWEPVPTHVALRLPPAARQCGYTTTSG